MGQDNSADVIAGYSKDEALKALEENLWSAWSNFGRGTGSNLYDEGGALWFDMPIPMLPYNTVLRFKVSENPDERIDALLQHYKQLDRPLMWIVHPTSEPADIGERLNERGLEEVEFVSGMVANLAELPDVGPLPDGVEVHEVTDVADIKDMLGLIVWRWNIPPEYAAAYQAAIESFAIGKPDTQTRAWLAWREGVPVAKALLHVGGGAAGLHGVVTKPEARGLGLARRLTLEVFKAAHQAGQQLGVLHSSPMAVSLYAKLGFREMAPFRLFASSSFHI